jgi:hypothetical protein
MDKVLRAKYQQCEDFRRALAKCKGRVIIENVPHDDFWGCGHDGKGLNTMGKKLMHLQQHPPPVSSTYPDYNTTPQQPTPMAGVSRPDLSSTDWPPLPTAHMPPPPPSTSSHLRYTTTQKPRALLIGNSHVRSINPAALTPVYQVEKHLAFTAGEAKQVISQISTPDQIKAVAIHLITNDVKYQTPNQVADEIKSIVTMIKIKMPSAKIILSLAPVRLDNVTLNEKVHTTNQLLLQRYSWDKAVYLAQNSRILCQAEYLAADGYHLNMRGTSVLAANLKAGLEGRPLHENQRPGAGPRLSQPSNYAATYQPPLSPPSYSTLPPPSRHDIPSGEQSWFPRTPVNQAASYHQRQYAQQGAPNEHHRY